MNAITRTLMGAIGACCLVVWLGSPSRVMAQVIVLSARGPSAGLYPEGAVLPANRRIVLQAGDRLEVLFGQSSRILVGPVALNVDEIDSRAKLNLQSIFRQAPRRPDIAAVRGGMTFGPAPTLWQLEIRQGADEASDKPTDFCLFGGGTPTLSRSPSTYDRRLTVVDIPTGKSRAAAWPAGEPLLPWPEDIPLEDGARYDLSLDGGPATRVEWRLIRERPQTVEVLARKLLDSGCYDQLSRLRDQSRIEP